MAVRESVQRSEALLPSYTCLKEENGTTMSSIPFVTGNPQLEMISGEVTGGKPLPTATLVAELSVFS
jgi:hypothetical protein